MNIASPSNITFRLGNLDLNDTAAVDGKYLSLTAAELSVLRALVRNAGRLVTHQTLLASVYGENNAELVPESNTLQVFVSRVRRKLLAAGATLDLRTVRLRGYMLEVVEATPS